MWQVLPPTGAKQPGWLRIADSSMVNENEVPYRREATRVPTDSSLVSDKRTCSLVNDNENMPRRVNWCDIVISLDSPEIFHGEEGMCSVIYGRQMCGNYYLLRAANYPGYCGQQLSEWEEKMPRPVNQCDLVRADVLV